MACFERGSHIDERLELSCSSGAVRTTRRTAFESTHRELDLEQVEDDEEYLESLGHPATEFLADKSKTIIAQNDSPDVGLRGELQSVSGV